MKTPATSAIRVDPPRRRQLKALRLLIVTAFVVGCSGAGPDGDDFDPPLGTAYHCGNGIRDEDEAAADCGGVHCDGCPNTTPCTEDYDCTSSYCYDLGTGAGRTCIDPMQAPPCENRTLDVDETDVDCGGPNCSSCTAGRYCADDADCESAECVPTTQHTDATIGQCWGDGYSGCTPVFYEMPGLDAYCGERILVMCQLHLPAAMQNKCNQPDTLPMTTPANLICCESDLF